MIFPIGKIVYYITETVACRDLSTLIDDHVVEVDCAEYLKFRIII